jgi:hypothetical protein
VNPRAFPIGIEERAEATKAEALGASFDPTKHLSLHDDLGTGPSRREPGERHLHHRHPRRRM